MPRILSVGEKTTRLLSRNNALTAAGYSVATPRRPEEAPLLLRQDRFDAVVIGHSVPNPLRAQVIQELKAAAPQVPVIFVFASPLADDGEGADFSVDVSDGPIELLRKLGQYFRGPRREGMA